MLKQLAGFTARDISHESYRRYVYDDYSEYTINDPQTLYVKDSDPNSHRVIDSEGECHYVRKNWLAIIWPEDALEF